MSLLIVSEVHRRYEGRDVLRGVSLQIDPGQKIGLVGRNGGGKSTLLRLIEGLESPDSGSITLRRGARLGHVPQSPTFAPGETVRAHVEAGLDEARRVLAASEAAAERLGTLEGEELQQAIEEHERLNEEARRLGAWEIERRVETVLSGIGLARSLWEREAETLSGGERSRTALARELVAGHDLLLLDEPTNHLDLSGIEWLESWLRELESAVLLVSHDRRLLESAVDAIVDLERGGLKRYPGSYDKFLLLRSERYETELRAWKRQQEFIRKEEEYIRRNLAGQKTADAKSRQKKLAHLVRLEAPYDDVRRPNIPAARTERGGELVLEGEGLAGGYGDNVLFEGLDLRLGRGQRVGIVGPNGAGKSTLLRILAARAQPLSGSVSLGHRATCGYYDQDTSELDESSTPYEEIRRAEPSLNEQEIKGHLARFLFRGYEVEKEVRALSGGERARLSLAKLLLHPLTWLAMDEPTNHLDLASRTALEELLGNFDGALVCISHDRSFLDSLCTDLLVVEDGRVQEFSGGYSAWRDARKEEQAARALASEAARTPVKKEEAPAAPRAAESGKIRNPWAFEKLEQRIIELEGELAEENTSLEDKDVYLDPDRLREAQTRIAELETELAEANERWENWA